MIFGVLGIQSFSIHIAFRLVLSQQWHYSLTVSLILVKCFSNFYKHSYFLFITVCILHTEKNVFYKRYHQSISRWVLHQYFPKAKVAGFDTLPVNKTLITISHTCSCENIKVGIDPFYSTTEVNYCTENMCDIFIVNKSAMFKSLITTWM